MKLFPCLLQNVLAFLSLISATEGGRVTSVSPSSGSLKGATKITLYGQGFAENQFDFNHPELGNNVTFVSASGTHALPCDVIAYYTSRDQIVCSTRPSPFGPGLYHIRVIVDGRLLSNAKGLTYCGGECQFKYDDKITPTIDEISPRYGLPGSLITLRGKIFTDNYIEQEQSNTDEPTILRIFAGSSICEPIDEGTKTLYGIKLDRPGSNTGYIKCRVSNNVASQRVSFIISGYGRSLLPNDVMQVDARGRLYAFQTHADISAITPRTGSMAGGTTVNITGMGFKENSTTVTIGGIACTIVTINSQLITCQIKPQEFRNLSTHFSGNRGLLREVWKSTKSSDLSSIGNLDSTSRDYYSDVLPDANSISKSSFGRKWLSLRLRGFFVAPLDNNYTFFIQAGGKAELYLSTNSSSAFKRKIASCPASATTWIKYPQQRSAVLSLKAGHEYFLEAFSSQGLGSSRLRIGVKYDKTKYVNSQVKSAVNEKQIVKITSTQSPDVQIINVTNWESGLIYQVQLVSVTPNSSAIHGFFKLTYNRQSTVPLTANATASEIQTALNDLQSVTQQGNVTVTREYFNGTTNYSVTFLFASPEDTNLLQFSSNGVHVTVTQVQNGKNGNFKFRFSLAHRISDYVHVDASSDEVKTAIQSMLSWQCRYQIPVARAWYYNGFEASAQGPEFGERVVDEVPYCGRVSLKNPLYLIYAGKSRDLGGRLMTGIDVSKYRQLCFAYKGRIKPFLSYLVSFTDQSGDEVQIWRNYAFNPVTTTTIWYYQCTSIHDNVNGDPYITSRANKYYGYYVNAIKVARSDDVYIDDVFIWRDAISVQRQLPAAQPGGHVIKSFDVKKIQSAVWAISLTPARCGTNIEKIAIADALRVDSNTSSDITTYQPVNQTSGSMVTVRRDKKATPPINGTFEVTFEGRKLSGLSSSISAVNLKSLLQDSLSIGQVGVSRQGSCAGYGWTIEWTSSGGNKPQIHINGNKLRGNDVTAIVETIDDGGMFLSPIPGDMLRVAETHPQVTVMVNGIPSSCSHRNCSFVFQQTATLTSITPTRGTAGSQIILTGNGFSTTCPDNLVLIGGVTCSVISCTSTIIKCTAGHCEGGLNNVVVRVKHIGYAKHVTGQVQYKQVISVNSVLPTKGSTMGGTLVTINGSGFTRSKSDINVTIGGTQCIVTNTSLSIVTCITSKSAANLADIKVQTRGEVGTISAAFQYDSSPDTTPVMTRIGPSLTVSVGGAGFLEITSSRTWQHKTSVAIGSYRCNITQFFSTYIKCTIPPLPPGKYDVMVHVPGKGYASYRGSLPVMESVLEIIDVAPRHGSFFGGTMVTIRGRGFSDRPVNQVVKFDDVPCDIVSSRPNQIRCRTRASSSVYTVDNSGSHPEYGFGYAWNPFTLIIYAGDTVKWRWSSPEMTNLLYSVHQNNDSTSTAYNGHGFRSARSRNGGFSRRFNVPGHFYYSSGPIDPYGVITMKGEIIVRQPKTKAVQVSVEIGQFKAIYVSKQPLYPLPSTANCHDGITSQCTSQNAHNASYVFWDCSTPKVTSIHPNVGSSSTVLTISGKGLGPKACYSEVLIGSKQCIVISSTDDLIKCRVAQGLIAGIPYDVTVRINNKGYAWIQSDDDITKTFTLLPTVTSLSPKAGSLAGQTLLTIFGDGFSTTSEANTVSIGPNRCTVTSSTVSRIQCHTQSHNTPIVSNVTVIVNNMTSSFCANCIFTYSEAMTPRIDYVTPTNLIGSHNVISMYGARFPHRTNDVTVAIGNWTCDIISLTQYALQCKIGPLPAGTHRITVIVDPTGKALFGVDASKSVVSLALVSDIVPSEGSVYGGTMVTISGSGFDTRPGHTTIHIGLYKCAIQRVTDSKMTCITSRHTTGSHQVQIISGGQVFPGLRFAYRSFLTPWISSVSPTRGTAGQTLTITGRDLDYNIAKVTVTIGNTTCLIQSLTTNIIKCILGGNPAGIYDVIVHVKGRGFAGAQTGRTIKFTYDVKISTAIPKDCGYGGGRILSIDGMGFSNATTVEVCNTACHVVNVTLSTIQCEVPAIQSNVTSDVTCSLSVHGPNNLKATKRGYFTYHRAMTSTIHHVDPPRGGTGGGTLVTITGNGFSSVANENKVTIAGITCTVTSFSTTQVKCITGRRLGSIVTKVRVEVGNNGIATQEHADFEYIDVWSSRLSWGGNDPPCKGSLVVIPRGQTMLLDVSTPVFAALVIKGKLKFDEKDLDLNAEKILVVDGGALEVGTEKQPFQHKARIVLHGNPQSVELPLFGAKVLAVREGTLDLHGLHVPITWTHLDKTAQIGSDQITLTKSVTWKVGDDVILASTSRSPEENEQLTITSVSSDGHTIGIKPVLKYKHIAIVQTIAGKTLQTRAEVGLLTRNVVVEGSTQKDWTSENFQECPVDFDPDQFATQTCFVGRYGDERNSDQFGSQIMLNAKEMNKGLITGRISYVEVRHAGQAFKLGRYPIHFHMSGDVTGSYVRGCAIHHTFNRAVTIHGVQGLLVEHNVAYHIMGHAYFIEDGIETGNTIQYNLGVHVTSSSSLLNVDVTPGTFWITNPNNTVRHNTAAGGSHFGFWYNMPVHPGGPSYSPTVWPRRTPLKEFRNNTAHSFGRYGLWIFPTYTPRDSDLPAQFQDFLAYNNLKGFEITEVGNVECVNCTMMDNKEAGFEVTIVLGSWSKGTTIRDSLVVGYSAISNNNPSYCTMGGVVGPQSSYLTLLGMTFVNFNDVKCAALRGCSFCRPFQGGWTVHINRTIMIHSPNMAGFLWQHETIYKDLDGSLTGHVGGSIVPTNKNLPPHHCTQSKSVSIGRAPGSICNSIPQFRRLSWNKPRPTSLLYKDALLSNQYGTNHVPWASKRITHKNGWMTTLIVGERYNLTFENAQHLSNISYSAGFYEFGAQDHVLITHPMKHAPDIIKTTKQAVNMSSSIPQLGHASTGDWFYNNLTREMTYIVTGETGTNVQNINLQVVRCYFKDCIKPVPPPPPEKRPLQYLTWSDPESWYGTDPGYGGHNKNLPKDGDDIMIRPEWWMVADTAFPSINKLIIYGTLELEPSMDFILNATYIYIAPGGNLIMGWPDQPMAGQVTVTLQGDWSTPDMMIQGAPNMGAKVIGVFGNLEIHGKNRSVYWTRLKRTADVGMKEIQVEDKVDWSEGDWIVIAPTSYRPHETEVVKIVSVSPDHKTIFINESLKYKHTSWSDSIGPQNVTMAAEVGLLTRNIVIEGADGMNGALNKQLFGCRVLVGSIKGFQGNKQRRIRIENAEFRYCGQEGWTDFYDPRYSLSFLDVPFLGSSYVRGSSFHHGYNIGIGAFGVNNLVIQDNVIHRTVGSAIRIQGSGHYLVHNLVIQSLSPATFNGRHEKMNLLWHAAFELNHVDGIILRDNAAAGSERIGFHIRGTKCHNGDPSRSWSGNVAHTCLHGVHIGYNDGFNACAKITNFVTWKNWDFGIFAYPRSSVMIENCIIADSKAGLLVNVYAPPALTHRAADKFVQLDNVLIIGTSPSFDCLMDTKPPINAFNTIKSRGPRTKEGGHIGFVLTSFTSGTGMAPEFPWHMIETYPAINGITRMNSVWFSHFGNKCSRRSVAIMTNPLSPDAMHPTEVRDLHIYSMSRSNLVYIEPPKLSWVNPSDCVDMDCDGHKEILIKDMDGSLTGVIGGSIISKAEFEWNGDPRRGLGDYRIPKAMLTGKDGSRLNASIVAPHHGIVRGTRTKSLCNWNATWNAYTCKNIDYEMLVIESLDADTEVRRLSPVALAADGFTNLLNGPQDHGWCFGYTCQERISTFYTIVATTRNYSMYFTGTNPEKLRLRLLNSESSQSLRLAVWYSKPQRLDVYCQGRYVYPTNANLKTGSFTLKKKDPSLPDDQFEPPLSGVSGSNYFDSETKLLFVVVRGGLPVDIRTMPIVQLTIGTKPVHINDFFEKNLIVNLAALLNIDKSNIRIVSIVNSAGQIRRRRAVQQDMKIKVEISIPPPLHIPFEMDESFNNTRPTMKPTPTTPHPYPDKSSYKMLKKLAQEIVKQAQTKKMSSALKLDVLSIDVVDPEPPRTDPTGGVRATNGTGGPSNGTFRYDQKISWQEGNKTSLESSYLIPAKLVVVQQPSDANETVAFGVQPKLVILDVFNNTVTSLGHGQPWILTAAMSPGTGSHDSSLNGNTSIPFIAGWANFTSLSITHSSSNYILDFNVTTPAASNIKASSMPFQVKERILYFTLTSSPQDSNETVPFVTQPFLLVRDAANGEIVRNTGWKGRKWLCHAMLSNVSKNMGQLQGMKSIQFISGVARFNNLSINYAGHGYVLTIKALTVPSSQYSYTIDTQPFNIWERALQLVITQQPGDCNDTVACGSQPILEIQDKATNTPIDNIGWHGRTWNISMSLLGNTTILSNLVIKSGRIEFTGLDFYNIANNLQLKFTVSVNPPSDRYSNLTAVSDSFDVHPRKFYLKVIQQPGYANESTIFGQHPVIEIRDLGTHLRATPLKTTWNVTVSMYLNTKPGKSILKGQLSVPVSSERAQFTDLMITNYGVYVLKFTSNYGHSVLSRRFKVRYINDYSPQFINATRTASILESTPISTSIITLHAVDKDQGSQGDVEYSITSGNIGNAFLINNTSGIITTRTSLDREKISMYSLVVRASDKAVPEKVRFSEARVIVMVTDVNDNAPVFITSPLLVDVNETEPVGQVIARVKAVDLDTGMNGRVKYFIVSGNTDRIFTIDENTGDIKLEKTLDLESKQQPPLHFTLGIQSTDSGSPKLRSNTTMFTINVKPVNEFAPVFTQKTLKTLTLNENEDVGVLLVDVNATDRDFGIEGQVFYSIVSGNQDQCFDINNTTGVVTLVKRLDYERSHDYRLVLRASDKGSAVLHTDIAMVIQVVDVNDNTPLFAENVNHVKVKETHVIGQTAFVVKATDADSGSNGRVSYQIQTRNDNGFFKLMPDTGEVKLLKSLDMEVLKEVNWNRTLVIATSDHGIPSLSSNASFVISVESVNEYSPVFQSKLLKQSLLENIAIGTQIERVSASDMDYGPDGQLRYSIISGNNEHKFRIDDITGHVFINAPIDYEHSSSFSLEIKAHDIPLNPANQRKAICHMDITIVDVNDNRPVFNEKSYYAKIKETAEIGSDVIRVQATDRDSGTNGEVHYSIISGNELQFFTINSISGVITTKQTLDLETQQHVNDLIYVLHVAVKDNGSPSLSNRAIVTIEITPVNEFMPQLHQPESIYVRIQDTSSVGSRVVVINATDKDFGIDGSLTYTIVQGNDNKTFKIDKKTGVITVDKPLDYQLLPRYFLVVKVTDGIPYHVRHSLVAKVTVRLTNALDNGGKDIRILGNYRQITCSVNLAEVVGINTSAYFNIKIVDQDNAKSQVLELNDNRVSLDDQSLSNGLFTVSKGDRMWVVKATTPCRHGNGVLIVRVQGVYSLHVSISVVGYDSLLLQVTSQQLINPNQTHANIAKFKRLGSANSNFEQADLHLYMKLTDETVYDITNKKKTSFHVTTNNVNVKVKLAKQHLTIDRMTSLGQFSVIGTFQNLTSQRVVLHIVNKFVVAKEITSVFIPGLVNNTLLGVAGKTTRRLVVTMTMDDASVIRVDDFDTFPGLVTFACKSCYGASIDSASGLVTLERDSWSLEQLIVSTYPLMTDYQLIEFYCNTQPVPGGVDIGHRIGSAITSYTNPISIYINTSGFTLLAYNITLVIHNPQILELEDVKYNIPYKVMGNQITLANVIGGGGRSNGYVDDLLFTVSGYTSGTKLLGVESSTIIDDQLNLYPAGSMKVCQKSSHVLGDVNQCGGFDVYDAALTMLCAKKNRCEKYSKDQMDFNKNGVIDESDAVLLTRAAVNQIYFVKYFIITKPDHKTKTCLFNIRTSLITKDNRTVSQDGAQVYIEFISKESTIKTQLTKTVFNKGKLVHLYDGHNGLWGGVIQLKYMDNGEFELETKKSHIEQHKLGVTMIQATRNSPDSPYLGVPLYSSPQEPLYRSTVRVTLAPNIHLIETKSHSPQLLVDIHESTSSCVDPFITKTINITFKSEFSAVANKEGRFKNALQADLMKRFPNISITKVTLSPGSIRVGFQATAQAAVLESFIESLWRLLQEGYSLTVDGTTFVAAKTLLVDGQQKLETTPMTSFPVKVVVSVCVTLVVLSILAGLFICCRHRFQGYNKWIKIKKMTRIDSRYSLHHYDNPQEQEMTFIAGQPVEPHTHYSSMPGTPDITPKPYRPSSAMSSSSVEAWRDESQTSTPTQQKKRIGSGKVSPSMMPAHRTLSKQNSDSRLMNGDSDSGSSTPEERQVNTQQHKKTPLNFNVAKALMDHEDAVSRRSAGLAYAKRQLMTNKEALTRQSSDSRLLGNTKGDGSPFTRPKLYKKMTWASQTNSDHNLNLSVDSSLSYSGSTTPNKDSRAVTPSNVMVQHKDLKLQDEPFTLRLPVNVLNTSPSGKAGPFTKLGFIEIQSDSSLTILRHALMSRFGLKHFVFEDSHMMDVLPSDESDITVEEMFTLSVIIKNITNELEINSLFCICDKVSQFQCSSCCRRGYCGRDCQTKDCNDHRQQCEQESVSTV